MNIKSMKGRVVDMGKLMAQNETGIALGNLGMNTRGDILGPGGEIVKKKEQVAQEYHRNNPNSVKKVSLKELTPDVFITPGQAIEQIEKLVVANKEAEAKAKGKKIIDSE